MGERDDLLAGLEAVLDEAEEAVVEEKVVDNSAGVSGYVVVSRWRRARSGASGWCYEGYRTRAEAEGELAKLARSGEFDATGIFAAGPDGMPVVPPAAPPRLFVAGPSFAQGARRDPETGDWIESSEVRHADGRVERSVRRNGEPVVDVDRLADGLIDYIRAPYSRSWLVERLGAMLGVVKP